MSTLTVGARRTAEPARGHRGYIGCPHRTSSPGYAEPRTGHLTYLGTPSSAPAVKAEPLPGHRAFLGDPPPFQPVNRMAEARAELIRERARLELAEDHRAERAALWLDCERRPLSHDGELA